MADSTLGRVGESMKSTAAAAQERARDQFASTSDVIKSSTADAVQQARSMMRDATDQQKHRAAEGLQGFARSLHDMARNLDQQHQDLTARYTHLAADQLERTAHALDRRSMDEMLGDVERFARRSPGVFVGTAFAAGFMLARFLKSGGTPSYESDITGAARGAASYSARPRASVAGQGGYSEYEPPRESAVPPVSGLSPSVGGTSSTSGGGIASPPPVTPSVAGSGSAGPITPTPSQKTGSPASTGTTFSGTPTETRRDT